MHVNRTYFHATSNQLYGLLTMLNHCKKKANSAKNVQTQMDALINLDNCSAHPPSLSFTAALQL